MTSFPVRSAPAQYRVRLPRAPEAPAPHPFPLLATVAPVFGAVALWAIIQSPFALLFAFLGPIVAVASVGDAKISARRTRRSEDARFADDCDRARDSIAREHQRQIRDLEQLAPSARSITQATDPNPEHWRRANFAAPIPVRLGVGDVPSALELDGDLEPPAAAPVREALAKLSTRAATLSNGPVVMDARLGIGICGPHTLAVAAARAVVVQLAAALSPAAVVIRGDGTEVWQWIDQLPHAMDAPRITAPRAGVVWIGERTSRGDPVLVCTALRPSDLPREVRVVLRIGGVDDAVVQHPDPARYGELHIDLISDAEATAWAKRHQQHARDAGLWDAESGLPDRVALTALLEPRAASNHGLYCAIGQGETGALGVDLVGDGPHAVVGGTTGSGKSELLVSWVLGIAAHRPPTVVSFLFVDFKGGASFDPLRSLPHCVGVITDLDEREALRALTSLRAEVRRRERTLLARGLRSIDDSEPGEGLARLVLVVDEYAAMVDEHPHLAALFTDLAARGRSLGIHLILCTQRPAGTLREGLLANCGLRLSLRVNNAADSTALLGTDAAAALPPSAVGRVLVRVAGGEVIRGQVAQGSVDDVARISERWRDSSRPPRPWCDPLPLVIHPADLADYSLGVPANPADATVDAAAGPATETLSASDGFAFAVADLPHDQRQAVMRFDPVHHGNLLVVGAHGSGKSGVLAALAVASAEARKYPADVAAVWDVLDDALGPTPTPGLVLLDDIDMLLGRCPDEWASTLADRLLRLLREGPARGITTVLTTQRLAGSLHALAALCGSTLLMRTPDRQEHVLAGGDPSTFSPDLPPGAGTWRGTQLQVVRVDAPRASAIDPRTVVVDLASSEPLAVVTSHPAQFSERLRHARPTRSVLDIAATPASVPTLGGSGPITVSQGITAPVLIGDPDAWLARWGALGALRGSATILFDGCSVAEFRAVTGHRVLPPPPAGPRALWVMQRTGDVCRAVLASAIPATASSTTDEIERNNTAWQRIS
jgi:S-DNA-T family DNA segregation ATPase FtsK/SpoIIIE